MVNRTKLLWASFLTLIAAGMGMAIRGAVLTDWGAEFGFSQAELGGITGGGLTGFGLVILICSLFADRIGYKPLLSLAFLLHIASFAILYSSNYVFTAFGGIGSEKAHNMTYMMLFTGAFVFAIANGICETVINPLVATLFPNEKTHYLNILHAGWPAGLILGGLCAWAFCGKSPVVTHLAWEIPMAFFLVPTAIYGFMVLPEVFPKSEAASAGVPFGTMLAQFLAPLMILLLILQACVGYVELGTDSWITNIMEQAVPNSVLLLVYTSGIMFILRFFAGPIVHAINPVGLLFISALCGCTGLFLLSKATGVAMVFLAATIYGLGKTFLWPTMLGLVGERFPKGGALTMGAMGGVGMLSAGILGSQIIGWQQDYFASNRLQAADPALFAEYKAAQPSVLFGQFSTAALDGKKVGEAKDAKRQAKESNGKVPEATEKVLDAVEKGGRDTLRWTAVVPASMAAGYLLIFLSFLASGGYKQEKLGHGEASH